MSLTITSLNYDILKITVSDLGMIDLHMLYLSNRFFKDIAKYDIRTMTLRKALESKNLEYVQIVENVKGKQIDINKHFNAILATNNLHIISYLILDPEKYYTSFHSYFTTCKTNISPEIVYYFYKDNVDEESKKNILVNNRIDIINYYSEMKTDLYTNRDIQSFKPTFINNIEFLKYIDSRGFVPTILLLKSSIHSESLEILKFIYERIDESAIRLYFKGFNPVSNNINKDIVLWLYERNHYVYSNISDFFLYNDMYHLLKPEDRKPQTQDIEITTSRKTIVSQASKGIFDIPAILNYKYNTIKYDILFYAIKYKRCDLYNLPIYPNIENFDDIVTVCELGNPDCLVDFYKIRYDCSNFLRKYADIIIKQNNTKLINILLSKYTCTICVIVDFYLRGMKELIEVLKCTALTTYNVYFGKSTIIQVCESDNIDLIMLMYKKYICLEHIYKYCSACTIESIINKKNIDFFSSQHTNIIAAHGNFDVVRSYSKYNKFDKYSIFCGLLNSTRIATYIAKTSTYEDFTIRDYFISNNELFKIKINDCENKKFCKSIRLPSQIDINNYYTLIFSLRTNHDNKQCMYFKPIPISEYEFDEILKNDLVSFYIYSMDTYPITKHVLLKLIEYDSQKIVKYLSHIGQLGIPFCCGNNILPQKKTVDKLMDVVLNYKCGCSEHMFDLLLRQKKKSIVFFFYRYIKCFDKIKSNHENNVLQYITDSFTICDGNSLHKQYYYKSNMYSNDDYYIEKIKLIPTIS